MAPPKNPMKVPTGWRARYRTPEGGSRMRTFKRREGAVRFLNETRSAIDRGTFVDPKAGRVTVARWWELYRVQVPKRPTTAARDLAVMRRWWLPALGNVQVAKLTPVAVRGVVTSMQTAGKAPATVRTNFAVFRAVMSTAVEADLIGRTPCRGVKLPAERREGPRFLTSEELGRLADATPVEYRPMIYVAGVLGLRWSEVAGLRVGRCDFLRRTVTVAETLSEVEGRLLFADVKTRSSHRTLTAPAELMEMLGAHLARRGRPGPDELVFVAVEGGPVRAAAFRSRVWKPAVERAGLSGITFHGLRHSAVGYMIELGAHPRVVQQRAGHSSVRTTLDVYGSVFPSVDEEVAVGLGAVLEPRVISVSRGGSGTGA